MDDKYAEYVALLNQLYQLRKEAFQLQMEYKKTFGELNVEIFKSEMECTRKSKMLAYLTEKANRNQAVNSRELMEYLKHEMQDYNDELERVLDDYHQAKEMVIVPDYMELDIKRLFGELVRKVHPDMIPMMEKNEQMRDIWEKCENAYDRNDTRSLLEEEARLMDYIKVHGENGADVRVNADWISNRTKQIHDEIEQIESSEPYLFRFWIHCEDDVNERLEHLQEELSQNERYEAELDKKIESLMQQ